MPTYEEYKDHHGELTEEQFKAVLEEQYTTEDYGKAFQIIQECTPSLPKHSLVCRLATIHRLYPLRGSMWKFAETFLTLGLFRLGSKQ